MATEDEMTAGFNDAGKPVPARGAKAFTLPPFDDPKYRKELSADLTDEQATELLRALDFILRSFVDLGFGVDAVQLALPELAKFSEQSESLADFSGTEESSEVQLNKHTKGFNSAAANTAQKDEET